MAVITLSRQFGSGGDAIAARLCEQLGYRYFDKQLMIEAAAAVGLCEAEVIDFSEERYKVQDFLSRLLRSRPKTLKELLTREESHKTIDTLSARELDEGQCVDLVRYAVQSAYYAGDVVIVGRGGQSILRNQPGVLHVRVVAPLEDRMRRLREQGIAGVAELKLTIANQDRATAQYLKRFFGVEWDDPTLYHLVINTGQLSEEAAVAVLVTAIERIGAQASA